MAETVGVEETEGDGVAALDRLASAFASHPRGLFITFEGGDGFGKTTQLKRLKEELESRGLTLGEDFHATFEPGATPLGAQLRHLIQHGPSDVDPRTEALLYAADRAYHVSTVVRPALDRGEHVLQDRYIDSSVAYQGAARELGGEEIRGLSQWATNQLEPDLTLLFDLDVEAGLGRVSGEADRIESAGLDFHRRVREGYLTLAQQNPDRYAVIDASGSVDEVFDRVVQTLNTALAVPPGEPGEQGSQ